MNEFIFGSLSTLEKRVAYLRQQAGGVSHLHRLSPRTPGADDAPSVHVTTELSQPVERVVCHIVDPELVEVELERAEITWDLLNWSYQQQWRGQLPAAPAGTIVRYRIVAYPAGGGAPLPADGGVRFSYLVGSTAPPAWAREAVIYQILPDRFDPGRGRRWRKAQHLGDIYGGTLRGIIERLDYVAELGFNCIWLNPFFPDESHHGYHATDYFAVNPRLGTLDDIRELVDAAHQRGIRLLLDFVANHWGSGHPTFQEALRERSSPYHDWYHWDRWPDEYRTFFGVRDLPQINVDHPAAREHLLQAASYWLRDIGFDGFRLDYALGPSMDFWTTFRAVVKAVQPDAWIFGEAVEAPPVQLRYAGRLDGTLDFLLMQALRDTFAFHTMDVAALDRFLNLHNSYFPRDFLRPSFLDNHDVNRFLWLAGGDVHKLKLAALCQFTQPGPPIVYYGTEAGLSQERDVVQERGNILEEARMPMIWGEDQDIELLAFYRDLIRFRRAHPVLWQGERRTVTVDAASGLYVYTVSGEGLETVTVALNAGGQVQRVDAGGVEFKLHPWSGVARSHAAVVPDPRIAQSG
ncbi:MAG: glycoside hydrolase family 13 protein [Candidatus Promineifilaceae bacterium]|nr:glycoside hydrolase family 13 protein [Candidatus Promineifilaceae bacterium]